MLQMLIIYTYTHIYMHTYIWMDIDIDTDIHMAVDTDFSLTLSRMNTAMQSCQERFGLFTWGIHFFFQVYDFQKQMQECVCTAELWPGYSSPCSSHQLSLKIVYQTHIRDPEGWKGEGISRDFWAREGHRGKSLAFASASENPDVERKTWKWQHLLTKEQPQRSLLSLAQGPGKKEAAQQDSSATFHSNYSPPAKHKNPGFHCHSNEHLSLSPWSGVRGTWGVSSLPR